MVAVVLAVGIHSLLLKTLLQYSDAFLVAVEDHIVASLSARSLIEIK